MCQSSTCRPSLCTRRRSCRSWSLSIAIVIACSAAVIACQVPVFRYALERWNPDRYQVMVVSRGKLSESQDALLKPLRMTGTSAKDALVELTNVDLSQADSTQVIDTELEKLWQSSALSEGQALMVARYPGRSSLRKQVAWSGPLTQESVTQLLDSPVRQELVSRLTGGDSAVWLLLESGDKEKDDAACGALEKQLVADTKRLALPSAEEMEISKAVLEETKIKLKISFSVLRLKRTDPKEKFLIDCLLKSEPDLHEYAGEPIAFPVFGRGIVLYAVVGKGISADVISSATSFIVGPCSCQVKEQNPGFDLLLQCDWDAAVGDTLVSVPAGNLETAPKLRTIPPGKNKGK